ncbi:DUF7331 family protein [Halorientalis salina]|uniref:DUF7331 family protein n=1 Tax=Halorientalis salina TaxID=2932266 RepID=UPI00145F0617|nr:hypothetical protein [Halorientalis salina]
MTRPERRSTDRTPSPGRYRQFTTRDALVVYDREDTSRWLQSDTVVSLDEME